MSNIDDCVTLIRDMRRNIEVASKVGGVNESLKKVTETSLSQILILTEELPRRFSHETILKEAPQLMETYRRGLELCERKDLALKEEDKTKLLELCSSRLLEVVEQFSLEPEVLDQRFREGQIEDAIEKDRGDLGELLPYWQKKIKEYSKVDSDWIVENQSWRPTASLAQVIEGLPKPVQEEVAKNVDDFLKKEDLLHKKLTQTISPFINSLTNRDEEAWVTLKKFQFDLQRVMGVSVASLVAVLEDLGFRGDSSDSLLEFERQIEKKLAEREQEKQEKKGNNPGNLWKTLELQNPIKNLARATLQTE